MKNFKSLFFGIALLTAFNVQAKDTGHKGDIFGSIELGHLTVNTDAQDYKQIFLRPKLGIRIARHLKLETSLDFRDDRTQYKDIQFVGNTRVHGRAKFNTGFWFCQQHHNVKVKSHGKTRGVLKSPKVNYRAEVKVVFDF